MMTLVNGGRDQRTVTSPPDFDDLEPLVGLHEPHSVGAMLDRVAEAFSARSASLSAYFVRSLVGGSMVAFGVLLSLVVSVGIPTPGVSSLVMGLAFGFSLVLILLSGMALVTADMAAGLVALHHQRTTITRYAWIITTGMIGNLIGALVLVAVAALAGGPYLKAPVLARITEVAALKASSSGWSAMLLAVLCTWFLQTAMFLYFKARTDTARMVCAFYGPFAFVAGGTQHVIANAGFIGLPLLAALFHPTQAGTAAQGLRWGWGDHGLLLNMVLTGAGNLIGGTVLVALPFLAVATLAEQR